MADRFPARTTPPRRPACPPTVDPYVRLRRIQQGLIDTEIRASRRRYLDGWRGLLRIDARTLADAEFLAGADRRIVHSAVIVAALSLADACDLRVTDLRTGMLRMVGQYGLPKAYRDHVGTDDTTTPTPASTAVATGEPVLIDDITTSPVLADQPASEVLRATGTLALYSYPLSVDHGPALGVLSLYYRAVGPHGRQDVLARAASQALADVAGVVGSTTTHAEARPHRPGQPVTGGFSATRTNTADVLTLVLRGAVDLRTAPDCGRLLRDTLTDVTTGQTLVIDLRELELLAVAGARLLVDTAAQCAAHGVDCYLVTHPDHHARVVLGHLGANPSRIIDDVRHLVRRHRR